MAVRIIDALEMIQTSHDYPDGEVVTYCRAELATGPEIDRTAIGQAGKRVAQVQYTQVRYLRPPRRRRISGGHHARTEGKCDDCN